MDGENKTLESRVGHPNSVHVSPVCNLVQLWQPPMSTGQIDNGKFAMSVLRLMLTDVWVAKH